MTIDLTTPSHRILAAFYAQEFTEHGLIIARQLADNDPERIAAIDRAEALIFATFTLPNPAPTPEEITALFQSGWPRRRLEAIARTPEQIAAVDAAFTLQPIEINN